MIYNRTLLFFGIPCLLLLTLCVVLWSLVLRRRKEYRTGYVFNHLPFRYLIADANGKILQYNFGADVDATATLPLRTLDDIGAARKSVKDGIAEVLRNGMSVSRQYQEGGRLRRSLISRLPDSLFGRPAAISISRDITEAYMNSEMVRTSTAQLESASEMIRLANFKGNPRTRECFGNALFYELCPVHDGRILPLDEWVHPDDVKELRRKFDELLTQQTDRIAQTYRTSYFGGLRYYQTSMMRDANWAGEKLFNGVIQDITHIVADREKHRADQAFWEESLNSIPVLFYAKDADNDLRYTFANRSFLDFSEKRLDEIIGKTENEINPAWNPFHEEDIQALEKETTSYFENMILSAKGVPHYFHTIKQRYIGADGRNLLLGISVDVTDQWRLMQDLKVANDCMSLFFDTPDINSALRQIMVALCRHLGASHCYLAAFDYKTMTTRCIQEYVVPGKGDYLFLNAASEPFSPQELWYQRFMENGVVEISDVRSPEALAMLGGHAPLILASGAKAMCAAGIRERDRIDAAFNFIYCDAPPAFSSERITNILAFASHLIQNVRYRQKQQERVNAALEAERFSNLAKEAAITDESVVRFCLETMLRESDPARATRKSLARVCEHLAAPRGFFFLFNPARKSMELRIEYSQSGEPILSEGAEYPPIADPPLTELLMDEPMIAFPNMSENPSVANAVEPWKKIIPEHRLTNFYAHRLMSHGNLVGFFAFVYESMPRKLTSVSLRFVSSIAQCFELLLERKRINESLISALDKAQSASKAKSFFIASVSHELRTPLNAVIAFTDLLKRGAVSPTETRECLDSISYSADALLHFVNDLLELAQLETGTLHLSNEPTDFNAIGEEMSQLFVPRAKAKGIAFDCNFDAMPKLLLDGTRVRQILFCIFDNAVKYTVEGGVTVEGRFEPAAGGEYGTLSLTVRDTGIGMSEEDQAMLMEPFARLSRLRGTNATHRGTGLGASLVKKLVLHMGGTVDLKSVLGKGSEVRVVLQRVGVASRSNEPADALRGKTPERGVLLVDDVPINLMVLKMVCNKVGIGDVVMAESGQEALSELKKRPFDLVLTDMWMPGMSGEELAQSMRDDPQLRTIPVIAVTADINADDNFDMSLFSAIVLKPVTLAKIKQTIGSVMSAGGASDAE